ncbi:TetR/AcrR family transcriptional regulator [Streptomyces sp. NPDC001833]|uniref:TetR/AcrR family transcriptional regulator n=1 Tax=Streptomyces sp. NPDC001833 TaxID=3154658 RepID=UPI003325E342
MAHRPVQARPGYPLQVISADSAADKPSGLVVHSLAKARIVSAAGDLFAEHGVGGTSLQMIADAIGVTKAAVYHQFKTKDEIVVAAVEEELSRLTAVMDAAEAEAGAAVERVPEALLTRIVDLALERHRMEFALAGDPVIGRYFADHEPFRQVVDRLYRLLTGETGPEARIRAAMLTAAIGGAAMHPLVADLDTDTVRDQLLHLGRRFLDLPG